MNIATRQIISWLLGREGVSDEDIHSLIETLSNGIAKGEPDSIGLCSKLITSAEQSAAGTDEASLVQRLIELHLELNHIASVEAQVDAVMEYESIISAPDAGPMGDRIRKWRLDALAKKLSGLPAFKEQA